MVGTSGKLQEEYMMAHEDLTQSSPHAEVTEQDLVQRAQVQQLLRDAIELLQPLDKAVLVLSDFEDLSNEDMPAALQDRLLSFLQTRLTRVPQACQGGRDQG
jgi:DNA-directed RNA polymerase specialized sigma24 family protein